MSAEFADALAMMRERSWDKPVTLNERFIIETIRLAAFDSDPSPTPAQCQQLTAIFRLKR